MVRTFPITPYTRRSTTNSLHEDAQFCILEQFFPDGPDHPFASTMMKHFKKLGAPLYSIHKYPSLKEQEQRFTSAGWAQAKARSLWELWSDDHFVPSSLRMSLDAIEPFDEWEEFALFASHYFLLRASTRPDSTLDIHDAAENEAMDVSRQFTLLPKPSAGGGQRRFGALISDGAHSVGHYGGLGRQTRLASTDLYANSDRITFPQHAFPSGDVEARMCHTLTDLKDNTCLLVGGRASPATVFQYCWYRANDQWRAVKDMPDPRFRHSAIKVTLNTEYVLIYGGKASGGKTLDTWLLWDSNSNQWQSVETKEPNLKARFGACLAAVDDTSGVMFGGMGQDGTILEDFWVWKLHQRNDGSCFLELEEQTERLRASPLFKYLNRFGATVSQSSQGLIIVGGIIPRQVVPFHKEIMLLDTAGLTRGSENASSEGQIISAIGLGANFESPRPLLVGHVSRAVDSDQILILGGGAVCFSFGTFWTEGTWLLQKATSNTDNNWALVPESVQQTLSQTQAISGVSGLEADTTKEKSGSEITTVPRVRVETASQFQSVLADGKPVIITGSDIGPCTELWTQEYLANAVGRDRKVG